MTGTEGSLGLPEWPTLRVLSWREVGFAVRIVHALGRDRRSVATRPAVTARYQEISSRPAQPASCAAHLIPSLAITLRRGPTPRPIALTGWDQGGLSFIKIRSGANVKERY
jgi:hypothetical protein